MILNFKSNTTTKVAANTIYQVIGKVISMSITMLAVIIITRTYGREDYGAFSLMQSWPALFFVIVDFGINAVAARELSRDWSKANKYLGNILVIRFLFSLLIVVFLSIVLSFFPYSLELKNGIRLGLLILVTQSLYSTTNIFFQVKLKYDLSTIAYICGYIVIFLLIIILSGLKIDIMWVNFSYVVGGVITFILSLLFLKKLGVVPIFSFDKNLFKYLITSSLPIGIMFIFSQMSFKEDALMLSILKLPSSYELSNTESVAIYSLAYKVFEVLLVLPTFFMNSVYPVLVLDMEKGESILKKTFSKVIHFSLFSGVLVGLLGIIFAPLAIRILGGEGFNQSIDVLKILSGGIFIFYLTSPISWLIMTLGYQKYLPWIYFVSFSFNMILNLIFIPKYSFYGASWITIASEFIVLILLLIFARKSWRFRYAKS
ncbi:MAG TPA: flippase [bacterium]|jgi:O-antigen/teichoic acid export membrane protein|nr:flippase [bacterium]HQG78920.1 flippase [bacterium]